jgi:hypothetical protein
VTDIVFVGDLASKRTLYFQRAFFSLLECEQIPKHSRLYCFDYDKIEFNKTQPRVVVKLDPPACKRSEISQLNEQLVQHSQVRQQAFLDIGVASDCYVNPPAEIEFALNKQRLKRWLVQNNIPCTPEIMPDNAELFTDFETLHATLTAKKIHKVFIKHNVGSGAAGILALLLHPTQHKMVAYTTCHVVKGQLFNTQKIWKIHDAVQIAFIANQLLKQGAIVEKWLSKARFNGSSYDLRIVYQFSKVVYRIARFSASPITNLHLNNRATPIEALGLSATTIQAVDDLCHAVMACLPNLQVAGIDVLLSAQTHTPFIIEINAQGDCLYEDMLNENTIYKGQIQTLCTLL